MVLASVARRLMGTIAVLSLPLACTRPDASRADSSGSAPDTAAMQDTSSARARSDSLGSPSPSAQAGADGSHRDSRPGANGADTARGIVRRVGPEPSAQLALVVGGESILALSAVGDGDSAALAQQLSAGEGLEVVVSGQRTTQRSFAVSPSGAPVFRVVQFTVRAADGMPARDGVLREVDNHWFLETSNGTREAIVGLPAVLRGHAGARVFLVGPMSQSPHAFGILKP